MVRAQIRERAAEVGRACSVSDACAAASTVGMLGFATEQTRSRRGPPPVATRRMLLNRRVAVLLRRCRSWLRLLPCLRRHKRCRDDVDAGIQLRFDLLAGEVFAVGVVIGR